MNSVLLFRGGSVRTIECNGVIVLQFDLAVVSKDDIIGISCFKHGKEGCLQLARLVFWFDGDSAGRLPHNLKVGSKFLFHELSTLFGNLWEGSCGRSSSHDGYRCFVGFLASSDL